MSGPMKLLVLRAASRAEQEIRAYPRVYTTFYRVLGASPVVRRAIGRAKAGVRENGSRPAPSPVGGASLGLAERRREAATAVRLGLGA